MFVSIRKNPLRKLGLSAAAALAFLPWASPPAQAADVVWLNIEDGQGWDAIPGINRWAGEFYNGNAFHLHLGGGDASVNALGEEGKTISWPFTTAAAGVYDLWFQIGYEDARSDIEWRVGGGEWQVFSRQEMTTDMRYTGFWAQIAWGRPARGIELAAGDHVFELRFRPQKNADGSPANTQFLANAFVFAPDGAFLPYGRFKPGEDHQTDADREASAFVFEFNAAAREDTRPPLRTSLPLGGVWELARSDEWEKVEEETRLQPMSSLPEDYDSLRWSAIRVPSDLYSARPDYRLAHRVLYRTRVDIPAEMAGRSFQLHVPSFSMVIGAFVNGQYLGGSKGCFTEWTVDATPAVKPGEVNEIVFTIKDAWYSFSRGGRFGEIGVRSRFNVTPEVMGNNWIGQDFDMPTHGHFRSGLLETPSLIVGGPVYAADVFVKTWVTRDEMEVEVEIHNPSAQAVEVAVSGDIRPWSKETAVGTYAASGAAPAMRIPETKITVPAGQTVKTELKAAIANVELWWPNDPKLYVLTTTVASPAGVDARDTRFGFREWGWNGDLFKLNGLDWQFWADCRMGSPNQEFVEYAKKSGQNTIRLWQTHNRRHFLEFMDEAGQAVRVSNIFDGQGANYLHGLVRGGEPNWPLFDNWCEQHLAQVRAERNHPSVLIWSIENEIAYINSNNLGMAPTVEPALRKTAAAIEAIDPTRPTMVDGGNALLDQSMPVNGAHYTDHAGRAMREIPDAFYDNSIWYTPEGRAHGNWIMAKNKPVFGGELFFANGNRPVWFTILGGDGAALGRAQTFPARGLFAKMLSEGYRWDGVGAWHMWLEAADPVYWTSWQPVAALAREWDRTFAAGKNFTRTFKLYNQTQFDTPITVRWAVHNPGAEPAAWGQQVFNLPPGGRSEPFKVEIAAGNLAGDEIAAGRGARVLTVRCVRGGVEIFREDKNIWILNPEAAPKPAFAGETLFVWDAHGAAKKRLQARGIAFREVAGLDEVPQGGRLLVGADTIPRELASSPAWVRFALGGGRVVMLDQAHPLRHQALPVEVEPTGFAGRFAFLENPGHPAFAGLADDDFFCRSGDHIVYRNVWRKSLSLKSLAQCDEELACSAYFEAPAGEGLLALCQFAVGGKLDAGDPVMTRLFDNLVNRLADYKPIRKEVRSALGAETPAGRSLSRTGVQASPFETLAAALPAADKAADTIVAARMADIAQADAARVKAFIEAGGYLVVNGLEPEHLAAFNALVGVEHMIRPMEKERVQFAAKRDWVVAGLSLHNLVMNTGRVLTWFNSLMEPSVDQYKYVVDANDDIAAFAPGNFSDTDPAPGAGGSDHYSRNMVNGFTNEDSWMFIWQPGVARAHWTMRWDRPWPFATVEIAPNRNYQRIKTIELRFDDDPEPMILEFALDDSPQMFELNGRVAQTLSFKPVAYHGQVNPGNSPTGVDTLSVVVERPAEWRARVHPVDNIGGIVRYSIGKGGVVLMNLNFLDEEVNAENKGKKDAVFKSVLANLDAVFAQGERPTAGWRLAYKPVEIQQEQYNLHIFRNRQPAWFDGPAGDLSYLVPGERMLADVRFMINDFNTSPVAGALSLAGNEGRVSETEITGLKVGGPADALFFLHTWHIGGDLHHRRETTPLPVFGYRVRYEDGTSADVPVLFRRDIGPWQSAAPASFANAAVAWAGPAPEGTAQRPVLYMMQWDNPSPEKTIATVELYRIDDGRWGAPAVLAITAATREE